MVKIDGNKTRLINYYFLTELLLWWNNLYWYFI